jgi:uncharacterized phage protein (TIGR02218 family)
MLDLTPAMRAKILSRTTTFCHCWRLTRRDGVVMGFTDHDCDLSFNDIMFRARTGLSASQLEANLGFAATGAEAAGILDDDSILEADLSNGLYDDASVETWLVDWTTVTDRVLLDIATLGEVRRGENSFSAELRSRAHIFDQQQGRSYQRHCAADLGDARCRVDLSASRHVVSGVVVEFAGGVLTGDLAGGFGSGFFAGGRLVFTSGANNGASLIVKSHLCDIGKRATLTLWRAPAAPVSVGDAFTLTVGCDKAPATCLDKFDNIVNFRGFPHMPGNDRVIAYPGALAPAMDGESFFR